MGHMQEIGADPIIGGGHKSMASAGPAGVLGMKKRWEETVLRKSSTHSNKEVELLGRSIRGIPLITLMTFFPYVKEGVSHSFFRF